MAWAWVGVAILTLSTTGGIWTKFGMVGTGLPPAAPGILVCWRTSEYRSVITIGPGSATAESVAAINREWLSLG